MACQVLRVQLYEFLPEGPGDEVPAELLGVLDWWGQDPDQPGAMPCLELWSHPARSSRQTLACFRTVEYPIHSAPKRFTTYLKDMKCLGIRLYGIQPAEGAVGSPLGLCEINLQPWLRGPDVDYALRVEGFFPVVRSHSDRMMVGQLRVCICTDWTEDAELRPKAEAIQSFEQHEWQARLTEERALAVRLDNLERQQKKSTSSTCKPERVAQSAESSSDLQDGKLGKLHLQVHLCGLCLQLSAFDSSPAADDLRVAFRFGVADEVTVLASPHEVDSECVSYLLGSAHVSGTPVWQGSTPAWQGSTLGGSATRTPALSSIHFHLWHGEQLLGLAALSMPATGLSDSGCSCLLSQDVRICSLRAGQEVGHIRVALHAGPADLLKAQAPYRASVPARLVIQAEPQKHARPCTRQQPHGIQGMQAPPAGPGEEGEQQSHKGGRKSHDSVSVPGATSSVLLQPEHGGGPTPNPLTARSALSVTATEETASCLWLVAAGISADDVLAEARRPHKQKSGNLVFQGSPGTFELEELCEGLLRAVDGLTPRQAAFLAHQAKCGQRMVSADLWRGFVLEASARLEAAVDLLQQEVGGDALGQLAEQLAALGMEGSLRHAELAAVLARHAARGPRWGLMEELLRLLDPNSAGVLPARPLAKLIARRAETLRLCAPRPVETTVSTAIKFRFQTPSLPAARQLLSSLFCLLTAGEVGIREAASCLDEAVRQVSGEQPALWCSQSSNEGAVLAGILETDKRGTLQVVKAWQALRLSTSASPAVAALRSLAVLENSELRVHETHIQEALALGDSLLHGDLMQTAADREEEFFAALLSASLGPEALRSRLRATCATIGEGGRFLRLDQFTAAVQGAGIAMANADVLEVARGWTSSGLLDTEALFQSHNSWLHRSFSHTLPPAPSVSQLELSRLDLPSYVLFACLDVAAQGHVSKDVVCQLETWPSALSKSVLDALVLCDPTARGVITYADFRRFCGYLDRQRPDLTEVTEFRSNVRAAIFKGGGFGEGGPGVSVVGRGLDAEADLAGLVRVLTSSMGASHSVAETLAGAFLAVKEQKPSYRAFLTMLRRSWGLLRRHADDLFRACFAASVDLKEVLQEYSPNSTSLPVGAAVGWESLVAALSAKGVDLSQLDTEDVIAALDDSGKRLLVLTELAAGFETFQARHGPVLESLAKLAQDDLQGLVRLQKATLAYRAPVFTPEACEVGSV